MRLRASVFQQAWQEGALSIVPNILQDINAGLGLPRHNRIKATAHIR